MTIENAQQTAYSQEPDNRALAGQASFPDNEYDTAVAGEDLHYGEAVIISVEGEPITVTKPINAVGKFWGVVYLGKVTADANGLSFYKTGDGMAIVTDGPVWAKCNSGVKKGQSAFVDALVTLGAFTNVSVGNQVIGAEFLSDEKNGIALVKLPSRTTS